MKVSFPPKRVKVKVKVEPEWATEGNQAVLKLIQAAQILKYCGGIMVSISMAVIHKQKLEAIPLVFYKFM